MYTRQLLSSRKSAFMSVGLALALVIMGAFSVMADPPTTPANTSPYTPLTANRVSDLPIENNCGAVYGNPYDNYYATLDFYVTTGGSYTYSDTAGAFRPYRMIYNGGTFNPANTTGCIYAKSTSNNATFTVNLTADTHYTLVMSHEGIVGVNGAATVGAPGETFTATLTGPGSVCWGAPGVCDDADSDNVNDLTDNCPAVANPGQENGYGTAAGDACEDTDTDGFNDDVDACPTELPVTDVNPADGCDDVDEGVDVGGPATGSSGGGWPAYLFDGRLNPLMGDTLAVAYPGVDDVGGMALNLYCINDNADVFFAMQVTADDLPESTPAVNTLVKASPNCNVAFYALSTGEYQINIGPDAEGKVYEVIFNGLGMDNARVRAFNTLD